MKKAPGLRLSGRGPRGAAGNRTRVKTLAEDLLAGLPAVIHHCESQRITGFPGELCPKCARSYGWPLVRDPISELVAEVTRLEVDAVFVPSLDHLEGAAPRPLVLIASLCTVTPEDVFDRKWLQSVPDSSSM